MKRLFFILLFFTSINVSAENDEWSIYYDYDYWKYPVIAITRNTSISGHRVRSEITCTGPKLDFKLIFSYPENWTHIGGAELILKDKVYKFRNTGERTEQSPKHYTVYVNNWRYMEYEKNPHLKLGNEYSHLDYTSEIFEKLEKANDSDEYIIRGYAIKKEDYEHGKLGNKYIEWRAKFPLRDFQKSIDTLKPYCKLLRLNQPLEKNPIGKYAVNFYFDLNKKDSFDDIYYFNAWFEPLMPGAYLNYMSGQASIVFMTKSKGRFEIKTSKSFTLPPLQGQCIDYFQNPKKDTCYINKYIKLDPPDDDLKKYEPFRFFDIDFDGENEVIIGSIGGNRGHHEYQIYELEDADKTLKAIPTISFRGDAIIDNDNKTLTSLLSSSACGLVTTTYKSDGEGFKMVKRVEIDNFYYPDSYDCVRRTYEGTSEKELKLISEILLD